ncbi:MAG: tetratricopeptide repeat protein [Deltaproteobacteria bacterium]|nr:tetratricopeptide repeat protein [Deltaproteobacteria bacterium]
MALMADWKTILTSPGSEDDFNLAAFVNCNNFAGAEAEGRRALKECVRAHGSCNEEALFILDALGTTLLTAGRGAEAEPFLREAVQIGAKVMRLPDPELKAPDGGQLRKAPADKALALYDRLLNLGIAKLFQGRAEEARRDFARVEQVRSWGDGPGHAMTLQARAMRAIAIAEEGRLYEASGILEGVIGGLQKADPYPSREVYLHNAMANYDLIRMLLM